MSCPCKRGNTELGEWKTFVPCPGPGHRYRMPLCILGTQPSWSPERGARAMISGRWEHHVLFVSREGQSPHWHLLLSWVQRGKDGRVLERETAFLKTLFIYLFLCACMWEAVGVQCMSEARKGHPICWRWSYRRLWSAPCEWQELNLSSL